MSNYSQIKVEPMDTVTGTPYFPTVSESSPRTVTFARSTSTLSSTNVTALAASAPINTDDVKLETPPITPTIHKYTFPVSSTPPLTPNQSRHYGESSPGDVTGFSFSDFLLQLEDYAPTLPDSVANHFLHMGGFESSDPRMSRLISIAAQKYISDIINDAFTHCKLKGQVPIGKTKVKDKKYVLTMDDLIPVLNDYGITVRKPPYYV